MFIENGFLPENKFWKYIVGSVLIILAATIGQIPLMVAIFVKSFSSGKHFPTNENEIMTFLEPNTTLFLILLSFVFAFFAIILVVRNFHKQTLLPLQEKKWIGKGSFFPPEFGVYSQLFLQ
jgi:ABC-type transport system involved in multi-copper enzyme maturation permease subunit